MDNQLFNYNKLLDPNTFVFNNQNLLDGIIDKNQINLLSDLNVCPVISEELTLNIENLKNVFSKCDSDSDKFKCSYELLLDPNTRTLIKQIVDLYTKINFQCTISAKNSISNDRKNTICETQNTLNDDRIKKMKEVLEIYIDIIKQIRNNIKTNINQFNEFCYPINKSDNDNVLKYMNDIDRLLLAEDSSNNLLQEETTVINTNTTDNTTIYILIILIVVIIIIIIVVIVVYIYKKRKLKYKNQYLNQQFNPQFMPQFNQSINW
jgi:hypothetical protein